MRSLVLSASAPLLLAMLLTGCAGISTTPATPSQLSLGAMQGTVHGGQQPVSGATIQLYQVGSTGYGTGAAALLTSTVTSDAAGSFSITGKYTCTSGTELYLTATGGNPGLTQGTNNAALALMAGLGLCDSLTPSTYISVNEITTVGAVWALSPFMTGTSASIVIGAPATNQTGLATAFADVAQIVNNSTGSTPGTALPTGAVAPTTEINTLADIVAGCVNSAGGSSVACSLLFANATPPGGAAPSNTLAAALNIARNPGQNVSALLGLANGTSPFQPVLTAANDFTLGVTYQVGATPAAVAIDASNSVWVVNNAASSVTRLTHAGVATTYTSGVGGLSLPTSIAIDSSGNAWIPNTNNSLTEISASGTGSNFTGGGLNLPKSVAIDGLGMIWVANGGTSTLSTFTGTGVVVTGSPFAVAPANGAGELGVSINPR